MKVTYSLGTVVSQTSIVPMNNPRGQIEDLIEQAKEGKKKLDNFMLRLTRTVNNPGGEKITYQRAANKLRSRVAEKCGIKDWNDPSKDEPGMKSPLAVKDIARATIIFSTIAQMCAVRDYIYQTEEFQAIKDKQSPAVKDLWSKGVEDEYKDVKFFLQVKIPHHGVTIPHIVELQLNVSQMSRGKQYGHAFYNLSRLATIEGETRFVWDDPRCQIEVPGKIKGKVGMKLRTALTQCRSMANGDQEVLLATNILSRMLQTKLRYARDHEVTDPETGEVTVKHNVYLNGSRPLIINCGPYDFQAQGNQDSDAAQAWAICRLSGFVWSAFTRFANSPGITGTASNWFAEH
ncbi:hypothetical protein [Vibrio sp. SCSIO 43136]|uniref:hypothetical protein n=1 Tax=Vibrio sp. SCSIO 43136 TaxID=2819101 RepID=UPI00207533DE|nr:hypothetical protein [Vibrio sp. SCSIO 43136]USD66339.1 hypothetical protein J4N39_05860 [Vibrio sp. SCSIO 43136]